MEQLKIYYKYDLFFVKEFNLTNSQSNNEKFLQAFSEKGNENTNGYFIASTRILN